ncbi:hypothetical protein [Natranaerovirga pectinivora]|nr:hypothetical protein [Natranaerovirga pectinivora]
MNHTIRAQDESGVIHTRQTFRAFVDATIPQTTELAIEFGEMQYFGALDFDIDQFMIYLLNRVDVIPLAIPTAIMLDMAAEELVANEGNDHFLNFSVYEGGGAFAALAPSDRFRAIILLEELRINLENLPFPYQNNPALVLSVTNSLNRITTMGYYSEWWGYGTTRLEEPDDRVLEYLPLSWEQVGYPRPSLGYRAFRRYLYEEFTE